MIPLNHVYNLYTMTVLPNTCTKYDAHKTSELKDVYKKMMQLNQRSPLYKFTLSQSTQEYALGIKEAANHLKNSCELMEDAAEGSSLAKTLISDDTSGLSVSLTTTDYHHVPGTLTISIDELAASQINTGTYVPSEKSGLMARVHSLDIQMQDMNYNFQIPVSDHMTNLEVQNALADCINKSKIGIHAFIDKRENESALCLESEATGMPENGSVMFFSVTDNDNGNKIGSFFGLNQISQFPCDSSFSINGEPHHSGTNTVSINNVMQLHLLAPKEEVHVFLAPDTNQVLETVDAFANSYNQLVNLADSTTENQRGAKRLLHDIHSATRQYNKGLADLGLIINQQGYMEKDAQTLVQSIASNHFSASLQNISDFKNAISKVTEKLNLNPIDYVDKVVVTYPNTNKTFPNPYMPSMYSGLLYNGYA